MNIGVKCFSVSSRNQSIWVTNYNKDDYVTSPALSYLQNLVRHEVFLYFTLEIYHCFATILAPSLEWSGAKG